MNTGSVFDQITGEAGRVVEGGGIDAEVGVSDENETYIERVCGALVDVLTRAAGGTRDRLAGYVANLEFWVAEAEHCLVLVKEYDERFRRFREAQQRVAGEGAISWDERGGWTPPPREVSAGSRADRKEARRKVVAAMGKFLARCVKDGLVDERTRAEVARRVN